jgi:uncharacterized membrane protein YsdA (DUF1294 family)
MGAAGLIALAVPYFLLAASGPVWLSSVIGALNVTTFLLYGLDKRFAQANYVRVPEMAFHGLHALGGALGGALGRQIFRHKTRKERFGLSILMGYLIFWTVLGGVLS